MKTGRKTSKLINEQMYIEQYTFVFQEESELKAVKERTSERKSNMKRIPYTRTHTHTHTHTLLPSYLCAEITRQLYKHT